MPQIKTISQAEQTLIKKYFDKQYESINQLIKQEAYELARAQLESFLAMELVPNEYLVLFQSQLDMINEITEQQTVVEHTDWTPDDYYKQIIVHHQVHTYYVREYLDNYIGQWSLNDQIYFNNIFLNQDINLIEKLNLLEVLAEYQISESFLFFNQYLVKKQEVIPADYLHFLTQEVVLYPTELINDFEQIFSVAFQQDPFKYDNAMKAVQIYCAHYFLALDQLDVQIIGKAIINYLNLVYDSEVDLQLTDKEIDKVREVAYLFNSYNE
ncbi:DUF3196 family protein [Ureaplasma sp. ES3154-GEN]|uniref:DUF3196 family protein n=1 Tax=Ureaplasma sp. ES3154-GEN TaxID=2984844 RepID=UPI0021E98E18|nr:DUF3196 family protein [Ureaplasma sp. ES3154-GEN]MCV3743361.1 DUF3196 family protein [Ureaplasma sp. ES3154-GEN]